MQQDESAVPSAPIMMTNEQFQSLIASMTKVVVQNQAQSITKRGNFSSCSSRFSGNKNEDVESFISAITIFKDCVNISDENAIKGLPMLLDHHAATWWQGIQSTILSWNDVLKALRHSYGLNMPPYKIFKLFSGDQGEREPTDIFVNSCRALIARLSKPPELHITHQIDMVYALLNRRIRNRLPRDQIKSFADLIEKSRAIEDSFEEKPKDKGNTLVGNKPSGNNDSKSTRSRPKCQFCNNFGHVQENCRKFAATQQRSQSSTSQVSNGSRVICYGCGAPGYIRSQSQCPTCRSSSNQPTSPNSATTTHTS
uniref:Activity-regulated cytoskeleton associated protein 2-like n=1 Tax=Diabrotica virgifera virgifera TaxID=50390 RepID=A0A6P7H0P4_DIAVI